MVQTFKQGNTVYSEDGQAAEYVAHIPDGHIVRPIVEAYRGDEEYEHVCDPVTWREVFAAPPVAKFNDELKSIHDQIAKARESLKEQQAEHRAFQAEAKGRAAERAKDDQLRYVDEFLSGKLTHYAVFPSYGAPRVMPIGDATQGDHSYNQEMRLLALYGKLDGTRTTYWQLHKYSDSSGGYGDTVVPARSEEEAEAHIREQLAKQLTEELRKPTYSAASLVGYAHQWGVEVPAALQALADEVKAKAEASAIDKARKDYASALASLKALGLGETA